MNFQDKRFQERRVDVLKEFYFAETSQEKLTSASASRYARVRVAPFFYGEALTFAHVVRRCLLHEIDFLHLHAVQMFTMYSEFSQIPGLMESVADIISNFRNVGVSYVPSCRSRSLYSLLWNKGKPRYPLSCKNRATYPGSPWQAFPPIYCAAMMGLLYTRSLENLPAGYFSVQGIGTFCSSQLVFLVHAVVALVRPATEELFRCSFHRNKVVFTAPAVSPPIRTRVKGPFVPMKRTRALWREKEGGLRIRKRFYGAVFTAPAVAVQAPCSIKVNTGLSRYSTNGISSSTHGISASGLYRTSGRRQAYLSFPRIYATTKHTILAQSTHTYTHLMWQIHCHRSKGLAFVQGSHGSRQEPWFQLDPVQTPVQRVNYMIERIGWYESVVFELWTRGNLDPLHAIGKVSFILRALFRPFTSL